MQLSDEKVKQRVNAHVHCEIRTDVYAGQIAIA